MGLLGPGGDRGGRGGGGWRGNRGGHSGGHGRGSKHGGRGGGRGRGQDSYPTAGVVSKLKPGGKKVPSIKNRIRSLERFINRPGLDAKVAAAMKLELETLHASQLQQLRQERERKYAVRYHRIRFFERVKIERQIRKLERPTQEEKDAAAAEAASGGAPLLTPQAHKERLQELREDLQYVLHFPKGEKYVSLLKNAEGPEAQAVLESERRRLRGLVQKQLREVAAVTEADEGLGARPPEPGKALKRKAGALEDPGHSPDGDAPSGQSAGTDGLGYGGAVKQPDANNSSALEAHLAKRAAPANVKQPSDGVAATKVDRDEFGGKRAAAPLVAKQKPKLTAAGRAALHNGTKPLKQGAAAGVGSTSVAALSNPSATFCKLDEGEASDDFFLEADSNNEDDGPAMGHTAATLSAVALEYELPSSSGDEDGDRGGGVQKAGRNDRDIPRSHGRSGQFGTDVQGDQAGGRSGFVGKGGRLDGFEGGRKTKQIKAVPLRKRAEGGRKRSKKPK